LQARKELPGEQGAEIDETSGSKAMVLCGARIVSQAAVEKARFLGCRDTAEMANGAATEAP